MAFSSESALLSLLDSKFVTLLKLGRNRPHKCSLNEETTNQINSELFESDNRANQTLQDRSANHAPIRLPFYIAEKCSVLAKAAAGRGYRYS